jgi:hypothetical protein
MCDPISAAGAALSVGSVVANSAAAGQVGAARSGVMSAENSRQQGWDKSINALNTQSQNRFTDFAGKQGDRAKEVSDFYKANGGALPSSGVTTGTIPGPSSGVLVQDAKAQNDKVAAYGDQQNGALAKLRSFGDVLATANRGVGEDVANIGTFNSMKKGSASVLPLELADANNAGNGLKTVGDIAGGLGKIGLTAGLSGAGSGVTQGLFGTGAPAASGIQGPTQLGFFPRLFR